ncbi:MAG: NrdJb, partial [Gammaproteobacteria bacterium]|nr:NrdJb [Gammaproteobacteria bacterium]
MIKIDKKIVGYTVAKQGTEEKVAKPDYKREGGGDRAEVIRMHEKLERPEVLVGSTYKVKTPISDHAMYVTINDIVLNQGTEFEKRRPFEIFINSKNLDHYQWIVALTRIISAVFRKGGDVAFLVDELKAVFDPRGGYWQPGGKFMPSIIAELGYIVEKHLITIGLLVEPTLDDGQKELIEQKRAEYEEGMKQQDAF